MTCQPAGLEKPLCQRQAISPKRPTRWNSLRQRGKPRDFGDNFQLHYGLSSEDFGQQRRAGVEVNGERPKHDVRRTLTLTRNHSPNKVIPRAVRVQTRIQTTVVVDLSFAV